MSLSRLAGEFAAEVQSHDWSDAPFRLDRAGHQRQAENASKRSSEVLTAAQTDYLRTNVMWVIAQVLKHADENLDLHEFAAACGVPRSITHRTNGSRSDVITFGVRWEDVHADRADTPGAPLWEVQLECEVANLVVFNRLLGQVDGFDAFLPPVVESAGGAKRIVTVAVRDWNEAAAIDRAIELVSTASTAVTNGTPAVVVSVGQIRP